MSKKESLEKVSEILLASNLPKGFTRKPFTLTAVWA
jgi:hypothetical protein